MNYSKFAPTFLMAICALSVSAQYTVQELPTESEFGWALGAGGGQIIGAGFGAGEGALLWEGPPYDKYVNLHPPGFDGSAVIGVGGGKQGGYGVIADRRHAVIWSGSAGSVVDLHRPDLYGSGTEARATDGTSQVGGGGRGGGIGHAVLWRGTAETLVELHPDGYQDSVAYGVWGDRQIGNLEGRIPVMWSGTAGSMVLLPLPKGYNNGFANGIHGEQIVGSSIKDGTGRAIRWHTDGKGFIDLTPPTWGAAAIATNGIQQVGSGGPPGAERAHAFVWSGTAETLLDLHQFLPPEFEESHALGIDGNGTIAGWARRPGWQPQPFVWTPVRGSRPIAPTSYSMFRGSVISGNLASSRNSDDNRLVMRPGAAFSSGEPPIQIILNAKAPTSSPTWFSFSLVSNASIANAEQKISLYNYVTGLYEVLDTRLATTSDGTVTVNVTSNPSRFIQPVTLAIKARVSFRAIGSIFVYPWFGRIDRAWWTFPG
ncbi:MAG: hypothetical protein ACR2HJ_12065 [Fimbriimonadales bacterium]